MTGGDVVERVAALSRLELDAEEVARATRELSSILDYVERLGDGEPPAATPTPNRFRPPGLRIQLLSSERTANAAESEDGAFSVPKVI